MAESLLLAQRATRPPQPACPSRSAPPTSQAHPCTAASALPGRPRLPVLAGTLTCRAAPPELLLERAAPPLEEEEEPRLRIESVSYQQGAYSVEGRLTSAAPPQLVYDVLTDYLALPRVFHNVDDCSLRVTDAGGLHLVQTVSWKFLIFRGSFATELQVEELPAQRRLAFSLLRSAFMRQFVGSWRVDDAADGGSAIAHALTILPVVSPPQRIGDITKPIFVSQVTSILEDLDAELDRRLAAGAVAAAAAAAAEPPAAAH